MSIQAMSISVHTSSDRISILLAKPLGVSGVIIGTLVGYGLSGPLYIRLILRELSMSFGEFVRGAIAPIVSHRPAPGSALIAVVPAKCARASMPS